MNDSMQTVEAVIGDGADVKALSPTPNDNETKCEHEIKPEIVKDEKEELSTSDDARLKGTALLKSLLSTSTASSVPLTEKMITTTEVTDEKLNLKKILYQPDKEKKEEKEQLSPTLNGNGHPINTSDTQNDDDDRRLVIDISDEEKDGTSEKKTNGKSMPSLNVSPEDLNNSLRKILRTSALETTTVPLRSVPRQLIRVQHSEYSYKGDRTFEFLPKILFGCC